MHTCTWIGCVRSTSSISAAVREATTLSQPSWGGILALWMSYEDTIRVADLKIRSKRFERVREPRCATPGQIVHVAEFISQTFQEVCETLPAGPGRWLAGSELARKWPGWRPPSARAGTCRRRISVGSSCCTSSQPCVVGDVRRCATQSSRRESRIGLSGSRRWLRGRVATPRRSKSLNASDLAKVIATRMNAECATTAQVPLNATDAFVHRLRPGGHHSQAARSRAR